MVTRRQPAVRGPGRLLGAPGSSARTLRAAAPLTWLCPEAAHAGSGLSCPRGLPPSPPHVWFVVLSVFHNLQPFSWLFVKT